MREWKHLNFFEHECYLRCRVLRIKTGEHTIEKVSVPWARRGSGFTMLMEAYMMLLVEKERPVSYVSDTEKETQPRVWRVFDYWVTCSVEGMDLSRVRHIGVDETSYRKGHRYITQFVNDDTRMTVFVTEGRDAETFRAFVEHLEKHGGRAENIRVVSMDMSKAFMLGCKTYLPKAEIVFDRFHVVKCCNEAIEDVRKSVRSTHPFTAYEKYTLLSRADNLNAARHFLLADLTEDCREIATAYMFKESFSDLYNSHDSQMAEGYLAYWCDMTEDSGLAPFLKFASTVRKHWQGITAFFRHGRLNNGLLEGINSKVQLARRRARGFLNLQNFIHMIYLVAGKLNISHPLYSL